MLRTKLFTSDQVENKSYVNAWSQKYCSRRKIICILIGNFDIAQANQEMLRKLIHLQCPQILANKQQR